MRPRPPSVTTLLALIKGAAGLATSILAAASPSSAADRVFGDPSVWRWAPSRSYHVENYRLKLHFDQAKGEVFGDEVITLKPFASGFRRFYVDSADLTIDSVSLLAPRGGAVDLASEQRDEQLWITLDQEYRSADLLRVRIVYHGFPRFGLFFDNPDSHYPDRPREIWTQGESEFNHHWFPCWDYPNDMATSETIVTVPEGEVVVSNGRLMRVSHSGGTVTYDWLERVPHSSYLTSLAIGPWRQVHDSYRGKPLDYYAPRTIDENTVRRGFRLTPDMIAFFSRLFVEYPYEKYAQVAVRDFVFGGQENVSATTLRDSAVLQDAQAAIDYPDTELVAHELAQHWFGDYVQARDWADIWLNEGFATYLPALYTQYREGDDAYRLQMKEYQDLAKAQDENDYLRTIVDHHYSDDGMQMFDQITHEKGAAVLDMMRYVLDGPTAASSVGPLHGRFFSALRQYLIEHAAQNADTADLARTIRTATGENLDWFFHEWIYMAGSPAYRVSARYEQSARTEIITLTQTQHGSDVPAAFEMPIDFAVHGEHGEVLHAQVLNNEAHQTFTVPVTFEPLWVDFDPDDFIEKTVDFPQPLAALAAAAERDPSAMARLWATGELGKVKASGAGYAVGVLGRRLAGDAFFGVRTVAAASLGQLGTKEAKQALIAALAQPDSRVRAAAASALGQLRSDPQSYAALAKALHTDRSYAVRAAASLGIGKSGMPHAFDLLQAERLTKPEIHLAMALDAALVATGDQRAANLLLADAQPGLPLRLRVSALSQLPALPATLQRDHSEELLKLVSQAMQDPYLPLAQAAERLVVALHLMQLEPELSAHAANAPTLWQRKTAQSLLAELHSERPAQ